MTTRFITVFAAAALSLASISIVATSAVAESLQGSNVDSRVMLGFQVDATDLGMWMPEGWTAMPFPSGPMKGATMMITFEDRAVQLDAAGKPVPPGGSRGLAFIGLAKPDSGEPPRLFVYRYFTSAPDYDPYGNATHAAISRMSATEADAAGATLRKETWSVAPEGGGRFDLSLEYAAGPAIWTSSEAKLFANKAPDAYSIFRYDQLVRIAASEPIGKPLSGELSYSNSIAELAEIFDGTEATVAILDIPVYVREVYLP